VGILENKIKGPTVFNVFDRCGVAVDHPEQATTEIVEHLCSEPMMVTEPWGLSLLP
jgi:hypothetical protein